MKMLLRKTAVTKLQQRKWHSHLKKKNSFLVNMKMDMIYVILSI